MACLFFLNSIFGRAKIFTFDKTNFSFFLIYFFTLQYCIGFAITSTCICHGCTHVPNPEPPSHHPPHNHPSGSSQCTSPKLPISCIEPGLAIRFLYDIIHVLMPFSQIIPRPPTESKRLFYTCVSFAVSYTGLLLPSF